MRLDSVLSVLLVEDSLADARLLQELLRDSDIEWCRLVHVETMAAAIEAVGGGGVDAGCSTCRSPTATAPRPSRACARRRPSSPSSS